MFTKVYYHLHKFELGSNFSAWLFRIAHNACMDELARKRKTTFFRESRDRAVFSGKQVMRNDSKKR
ncbi:hypothetical protein C2W64_02718 [Brevibacillus laterosporus]|nr:sigma factor [Brevibacillus laterosporus]RAP30163.1 hypothetical protein C2W64_02718 [Brevibacillus laterosporus]